ARRAAVPAHADCGAHDRELGGRQARRQDGRRDRLDRQAVRSGAADRHRSSSAAEVVMALDLAQFHDAFFDESFEALDTMEAALLKLNIGAPEPEVINTIFRVAHSIKGGSATFGFSEVASFT